MALLPIDDATRSLNDSILPSVMIWDGGDAYEQLVMRNALPATDPRSLDLDACAIAVGIYRVMTAAAEKALPPAPCDEPPEDGDGLPAPGRSPAGAVGEAEAPDMKALQAENERLKAELAAVNNEFGSQTPDWPEAWKRVADLKQLAGDRWRDNVDLKEQVHVLREDLTRVLAERNTATTALAESERKRVEAEAENGKLRAMIGFNEPGGEPMDGTEFEVLDKCQVRWLPYAAEHRKRTGKAGRWQHHTGYGWENCEPPNGPWRLARPATPTQETPDDQG